MKPIIRLMMAAVLPLCGSVALEAQDALPPTSAPAPPPALDTPRQPLLPADNQFERSRQALSQDWQKGPRPVPAGASGGMVYGAGGARFQERLQRIIGRTPGAGLHPMIIRSSPMDPKDQAGLEEDLAVMAHILSKALDEVPDNRPPTAMGIDVFATQGPGGIKSLYLEGYGALFTINVGLPLLAAPPGPDRPEKQAAADSTWEEAKQELYGQPPGAIPGGGPIEPFNAEKVTRLTDTLVNTLKNAANIRGLKPGDWVTVCVQGAGSAPARNVTTGNAALGVVAAGPPTPPGGTVMTVRARKADVDSFAKGKLTVEQFRKEARIESYEDASAASPVTGIGMGRLGGTGGGGGYGKK